MNTPEICAVLERKGFIDPTFDTDIKVKWRQNTGRILNLRFNLDVSQTEVPDSLEYTWRIFADNGELVAVTDPAGNPIHGLEIYSFDYLNEWPN